MPCRWKGNQNGLHVCHQSSLFWVNSIPSTVLETVVLLVLLLWCATKWHYLPSESTSSGKPKLCTTEHGHHMNVWPLHDKLCCLCQPQDSSGVNIMCRLCKTLGCDYKQRFPQTGGWLYEGGGGQNMHQDGSGLAWHQPHHNQLAP